MAVYCNSYFYISFDLIRIVDIPRHCPVEPELSENLHVINQLYITEISGSHSLPDFRQIKLCDDIISDRQAANLFLVKTDSIQETLQGLQASFSTPRPSPMSPVCGRGEGGGDCGGLV